MPSLEENYQATKAPEAEGYTTLSQRAGEPQASVVGQEVLSELVKSYGFDYNEKQGWSWSTGNVAKAFQNHPILTSLDYLSLALPVAKWGEAASLVAKGAEAAGAAEKVPAIAKLATAGAIGGKATVGAVIGGEAGHQIGDTGDEIGMGTVIGAGVGAVAGGILGIRSVQKGSQWAGRALAAGEFVAQEGEKGSEFGRAVAKTQEMRAPAGRIGQYFRNYGSVVTNPEDQQMLTRYGMNPATGQLDPGIDKLVVNSLNNQKILADNISTRIEERVTGLLNDPSLDETTRKTMVEFLDAGYSPESLSDTLFKYSSGQLSDRVKAGAGEYEALKSVADSEAYKQLWGFRNKIHYDALKEGRIHPYTFIKNYQTYAPRLYQELEAGSAESAVGGASNRLRTRALEAPTEVNGEFRNLTSDLTQVLDPQVTLKELLGVHRGNTKAAYINNLMKLGISKDTDALVEMLAKQKGDDFVLNGNKLEGMISDAVATKDSGKLEEALKAIYPQDAKVIARQLVARKIKGPEAGYGFFQTMQDVKEKFLTNEGFTRFDTTMVKHPSLRTISEEEASKLGELQPYAQKVLANDHLEAGTIHTGLDDLIDQVLTKRDTGEHLGQAYLDAKNQWLPKGVATDIEKFLTPAAKENSGVMDMYDDAMNLFRWTKTAWNPATLVRNVLGNYVSRVLTTGAMDFRNLTPFTANGVKEFISKGAEYEKAVQAGIIDSSFLSEDLLGKYSKFMEDRHMRFTKFITNPENGVIASSPRKALELYDSVDKIARLDAWMINKRKYMTSLAADGVTENLEQRAADMATRDVFRFFPSFNNQSAFTQLVRRFVPFSGYGAEAARFWTNGMIYKPHVTLGLTHMADMMSHGSAAIAGISEDELEQAKSSLPYYNDGKQYFVLPWRDSDGKVQFLDLSYITPLGDLEQRQKDASRKGGLMGAPILEMFNPANSPLLSATQMAITGKDSLQGQPLKPGFAEKLGVNIENPSARAFAGFGEEMLRQFLPPLVPPGYAGQNLYDALMQTKDPSTGMVKEPDLLPAAAKAILGLKTYKPSPKDVLLNERAKKAAESDSVADAWRRYSFARANSHDGTAADVKAEIIRLKGQAYFAKNVEKHEPSAHANVSREALKKALTTPGATPEELSSIREALSKKGGSKNKLGGISGLGGLKGLKGL